MNNKAEFTEALFAAFEVVDKPKPSNAAVKMWYGMIETAGITYEQAIKGIAKHMYNPDSGQFTPKPADIIKQLMGTSTDKKQLQENAAEVAWGRLQNIIRTKSPYDPLLIDDIKLMNAIDLSGGWVKLCTTETDNEAADRAAFRKAYTAANGVKCRKFHPGIHADGKLQMIGDPDKCKHILENGSDGTTVHELSSKSLQQLTA